MWPEQLIWSFSLRDRERSLEKSGKSSYIGKLYWLRKPASISKVEEWLGMGANIDLGLCTIHMHRYTWIHANTHIYTLHTCENWKKIREKWIYCSSSFILFIQSRIPACGMVPPTVSIGLPTAINLIYIIPHSPALRFVSMVIQDPVTLTIRLN